MTGKDDETRRGERHALVHLVGLCASRPPDRWPCQLQDDGLRTSWQAFGVGQSFWLQTLSGQAVCRQRMDQACCCGHRYGHLRIQLVK